MDTDKCTLNGVSHKNLTDHFETNFKANTVRYSHLERLVYSFICSVYSMRCFYNYLYRLEVRTSQTHTDTCHDSWPVGKKQVNPYSLDLIVYVNFFHNGLGLVIIFVFNKICGAITQTQYSNLYNLYCSRYMPKIHKFILNNMARYEIPDCQKSRLSNFSETSLAGIRKLTHLITNNFKSIFPFICSLLYHEGKIIT